ncbi:MAG TPA: NUDIX hydrolase [Kofleriaceae bacterium]|nr:NUDIX hydrolase [Kofleriaceae bacterium]
MPAGTPTSAEPRDSAAVILVRRAERGAGLEVLLVRRHRKASFMSGAYVFPGGIAEPGEDDLRAAAARELAEEAGVALPGLDGLHYFAHWITPSIEPRRYSARFYIAALAAAQPITLDAREIEDAVWVSPDDALARAGELHLPPPQIRSFLDIAPAARDGLDALIALCAERSAAPHPILPRACADPSGLTLLLPWDPDYMTRGEGAALAIPPDHLLATGPSRFVLEGSTWKHVHAPPSARAG